MFGIFSSKKKKVEKNLSYFAQFSTESELEQLRSSFENSECGLSFSNFGITEKLAKDKQYPVLHPLKEDVSDIDFLDTLNANAKTHVKKQIYAEIAADAQNRFTSFFDTRAEMLSALLHQYFSTDQFSVLIVADKLCYADTLVEILHSVHPHSKYVKADKIKAGDVTLEPTFVKGKVTEQGLLADMNEGLLSIHNFDKLDEKTTDVLFAVMQNQSLVYEVSKKKFKLPVKVNIQAFTLPNTAHFVGKAAGLYKQQMPVPAEVQEKFNLVVCVRCRQEGCLRPLTFSETDLDFVQDYISYAHQISVTFPKQFEKHVVDWHKLIAADTKKYIVPVTSQLAITLIRFAVAHARMHLRDEVTIEDLKYSMDFLQDSLGLFDFE